MRSTICRAALAVACLCLCLYLAGPDAASAQIAPDNASASAAVQAPQSDYAAFRALNQPFRLIDFLAAMASYQAAKNRGPDARSQAATSAYAGAYVDALYTHREAVIDVVMRRAFAGFSHDEAVSLSRICAGPVLGRVQTYLIDSLRSGRDVPGDVTASRLRNDPDFSAMTPADQVLLMRFYAAMMDGLNAARPVLAQFNQIALARVNGRREPKFVEPSEAGAGAGATTEASAPAGPLDPPLEFDAARYLHHVFWVVPFDESAGQAFPDRALAAKVAGDVVLDCGVRADGRLSDCDVRRETPPGYGFGQAAAGYVSANIHADPATVTAGIPSGARARLVIHWAQSGLSVSS